ncbi:hypothetical protein P9112_010125 [Eukaryota sp. TZLM1-RC]
MELNIDGLRVAFPYSHVYPEQVRYMFYVKKTLELNGNGILEMPTGAGKTVALLTVSLAFQLHKKLTGSPIGKILYCTRTIPEITQVMEEVNRCVEALSILDIRPDHKPKCLALSSRKALCIHPDVKSSNQIDIDSQCFSMTAPFVRNGDIEDIRSCSYYDAFDVDDPPVIAGGVFSLKSLQAYGQVNNICPYFLARKSIYSADLVVMSYLYLIDPKVSNVIESHKLIENSIILLDEAHNLDDSCLSSYSIDLSLQILSHATVSITKLTTKLAENKSKVMAAIESEFKSALVRSGKIIGGLIPDAVLPADLRIKAVPFSLKKAEFFLSISRRIVDHFRTLLKKYSPESGTSFSAQTRYVIPSMFVTELEEALALTSEQLQMLPKIFSSVITALEIVDVGSYAALSSVLTFCQLVSTFDDGFLVVFEPSTVSAGFLPPSGVAHQTGRLRCACLDSSLAMKNIITKNNSIILTSATLTPLDVLPRILGLSVLISESFPLSLPRSAALPLVVTKGDDQSNLSTRFTVRSNASVLRNYALLISNICSSTPDGVVVFFPSNSYLLSCLSLWKELDMIQLFTKHKILLIENSTDQSVVSDHIVASYSGRGSLLFAVVRGRVSEGVDLQGPIARAVILLGLPFRNISDPCLKARLGYVSVKYGVSESDWLVWDALRASIQCVGRAIRSKDDYALIVLADKRFNQSNRLEKLPPWLRKFVVDQNLNISVDFTSGLAQNFFREMSKKLDPELLENSIFSREKATLLLGDLVESFSSKFSGYSET